MKKIYGILTVLLAVLLSGCSDFFEQVPKDRVTIDQVFEKEQSSLEYLANVYNYMKDMSYKVSDNPFDGCSDDMDVVWARTDLKYYTHYINIGNWNPASGYYDYWSVSYDGIRSATYFMNNILNNKEMVDNNREDKIVQYRAEARFVRAWLYFAILRQYGPFVNLSETDDLIDPNDMLPGSPITQLSRMPYDDCVEFICNELDIAARDLPLHFTNQPENEYGRATQAMCLGLKSRLRLLAASPLVNGNKAYTGFKNNDGTPLVNTDYNVNKWEEAAKAAKDVIDLNIFGLYKEYYPGTSDIDPYMSCRNVFLEPWNNEVIMCRIKNGLVTWDRNTSPRIADGYAGMGVTQQLVDAFHMSNGKMTSEAGSGYVETGFSTTDHKDSKTGYVFAPTGTWNMYVNREPRFYVNVAFNGAYWIGDEATRLGLYFSGNTGKKGTWNYSKTGYLALKNVHPNFNAKTGTSVTRPWVMMRYAEILLNYAEALNEAFDTPDSAPEGYTMSVRAALNQIRERAGLPNIPAGLSKEQMREKIRNERRVELALEDMRYFDTRRWLIAPDTDGGPFWGMNVDAGNSFTDTGFYERTIFETRVFKPAYYFYPIPQGEIDRSKNVVQNPGW